MPQKYFIFEKISTSAGRNRNKRSAFSLENDLHFEQAFCKSLFFLRCLHQFSKGKNYIVVQNHCGHRSSELPFELLAQHEESVFVLAHVNYVDNKGPSRVHVRRRGREWWKTCTRMGEDASKVGY